MAATFGTSGLRGLVSELTREVVRDHTGGFLSACDAGTAVCIGEDLRPSSPGIARWVAEAVVESGRQAIACGAVPTPALALEAQRRGCGAVMVTGSHIPADRNGLKFYTRSGEITKDDEARIGAALGVVAGEGGDVATDAEVGARFRDRFTRAFGPALRGWRIGVHAHTAVGRDLLRDTLEALGADCIELGREEVFVPLDTEAVPTEVAQRLIGWTRDHDLHAIASTDGDSDRPLLTDETGAVIPGDLLGQITARFLGAEAVVTPISSNGGVADAGFAEVLRTRIGSPYVLAGMAARSGRKTVGYEANGGFLLGFAAEGPTGPLAPLPTRDSFLPIIATLAAATPGRLSARVSREPPVVTRAGRLQDVPAARSAALIERLADAEAREAFLSSLGCQGSSLDRTDGLRMSCDGGRIVHLRPSGNAPELRVYVEARDAGDADALLAGALARVASELDRDDG